MGKFHQRKLEELKKDHDWGIIGAEKYKKEKKIHDVRLKEESEERDAILPEMEKEREKIKNDKNRKLSDLNRLKFMAQAKHKSKINFPEPPKLDYPYNHNQEKIAEVHKTNWEKIGNAKL